MASRPLAQILRGRNSSSNRAAPSASIASYDIDIAALEQELQSSLPSPSSSPSPVDRDRDLIEVDQGGAVLRVVSSLLADSSLRIDPLPPEQLPAARCGSRLGLGRGPRQVAGMAEQNPGSGRDRVVRFAVEGKGEEGDDGPAENPSPSWCSSFSQRKKPRRSAPSPSQCPLGASGDADAILSAAFGPRGVDAGLLRTVKELVLDNYRPAERVPFYCRLCRWARPHIASKTGQVITHMQCLGSKPATWRSGRRTATVLAPVPRCIVWRWKWSAASAAAIPAARPSPLRTK